MEKLFNLRKKDHIGPGTLKFVSTPDPYKLKYKNKTFKSIELAKSYKLERYDYRLIRSDSKNIYDNYEDSKRNNEPGFSYLIVEI